MNSKMAKKKKRCSNYESWPFKQDSFSNQKLLSHRCWSWRDSQVSMSMVGRTVLKLARVFWLDGIIKIGDRECNGIPRWACLVVICGPDRGPDPTTDERDSVSARSSRFTVSFHENHAMELFRRTLWPIKNCRRASFIAIVNEMRLCKQFEELIIINNRGRETKR